MSTVAPTNNNAMDPAQRTRLLRTARKIEALLGTTPQVVGRNDVYVSQFSSSASSLESTSSEDHHPRRRPDVRNVFSADKSKKSKGARQPLAQPLLLRMSAVPVDHRRRQSTNSIVFSSPPRPRLVPPPIPAPPLITPFERRKFKVDSVLGPLSPLNTSHFPSRPNVDLDLPPTPVASVPDMQDTATLNSLTDREKRIKMAKLQRMMGENVPPELVFRDTTRKLVLNKSEKRHRRRSRSLSAPRNAQTLSPEEQVARICKGKGKETDSVRPLPPLPTLPVPTSPPPRSLPPTPTAPLITQTTTTTTSIPLFRQLSLSMKQKSRKSRPKSLYLGTASAFVAANIKLAQQEKEVVETAETVRGTVSLDEGRHWLSTQKRESDNDEVRAVECPDAPFRREKERIENISALRTEIWRRKEQEWSGEWNIQDMDEVAKALRGLKAN